MFGSYGNDYRDPSEICQTIISLLNCKNDQRLTELFALKPAFIPILESTL